METLQDVVAEALGAFEGKDCDVMLASCDGQPQLEFYGRLTGAAPVDQDGREVELQFAAIGGEHRAGGVTLTADVTAQWRTVDRHDAAGEPLPSDERYLALKLDGREVLLCRL